MADELVPLKERMIGLFNPDGHSCRDENCDGKLVWKVGRPQPHTFQWLEDYRGMVEFDFSQGLECSYAGRSDENARYNRAQ